MNITTKFDLGDYVWPIIYTSEAILKDCDGCKGKGRVIIDDNEFVCCECNGQKCILDRYIQLYKVYEPSIIGNIRVSLYNDKSIGIYRNKDERTYMLKSTGVGSGTLWNEDHLFKSEAEAQKECDRLNLIPENHSTSI